MPSPRQIHIFYFDIELPYEKTRQLFSMRSGSLKKAHKAADVMIELVANEAFIEEKKKRFGQRSPALNSLMPSKTFVITVFIKRKTICRYPYPIRDLFGWIIKMALIYLSWDTEKKKLIVYRMTISYPFSHPFQSRVISNSCSMVLNWSSSL